MSALPFDVFLMSGSCGLLCSQRAHNAQMHSLLPHRGGHFETDI